MDVFLHAHGVRFGFCAVDGSVAASPCAIAIALLDRRTRCVCPGLGFVGSALQVGRFFFCGFGFFCLGCCLVVAVSCQCIPGHGAHHTTYGSGTHHAHHAGAAGWCSGRCRWRDCCGCRRWRSGRCRWRSGRTGHAAGRHHPAAAAHAFGMGQRGRQHGRYSQCHHRQGNDGSVARSRVGHECLQKWTAEIRNEEMKTTKTFRPVCATQVRRHSTLSKSLFTIF